MIFRQLFDTVSSTYTYVLGDETSKEAVIIDPVFEQASRDLALINELGLSLKYAIDTHCHADHVTGSWQLKQKTQCKILCAEVINAENVDVGLNHGDNIKFGESELQVRATPGHTDGCLTFVCHAEKIAFTGDALLIRGCGRCDFQQGDAAELYDSIKQQVLSLDDDFMLYPGHDYSGRCATSVLEEKAYNSRLGGDASKEDFVGYMENMVLPHPKFIDIALPANMRSGKPEVETKEADWAPLQLTYGGVFEVSPSWVANNLDNISVVDVREPNETAICRVAGATLIPLGELSTRLTEIKADKPVVTFCRSGKRSALAATILSKAGFDKVANITGGLIEWEKQGFELENA